MNTAQPHLTVLHTSDWHMGRSLFGRKRYEEFDEFLSWLLDTIRNTETDVLLVAGDMFDITTPGNRAQEQYYRFLSSIRGTTCRHVVIVAGNHDSPSFLDAPRDLLKTLDVHVVGSISDDPVKEVLVLSRPDGSPELIVCAVPYLRDHDIRKVEAGESVADKDRKIIEGIRNHYAKVAALAEQKRSELGIPIPIIAMGHLFVTGGRTMDGDGVRELYIGSLAHVHAGIFPSNLDYVALGHLHIPQNVNQSEIIRYSGSPLPMGFGEASQRKSVCLVQFTGRIPSIRMIDVPVFQPLEQIRGDWDHIRNRLWELARNDSPVWIEIIYDGNEIIGNLRERLDDAISHTKLEILRIRNNRVAERVLEASHPEETLPDLTEYDMFDRVLEHHHVPDHQRPELIHTYNEIVKFLLEHDAQAE